MNRILVTGGAGFIGYHVAKSILNNDDSVQITVIDNLNTYYDQKLKRDRIENLCETGGDRVNFIQIDIADSASVSNLFNNSQFSVVVHLAAQAGVRYARENPDSYISSNIVGFYNIISNAKDHEVNKFIYASSSSVYGSNTSMPFKEDDKCATPMSLYAATKLSNESLAASYYYSEGLKTVGLRFFNVYGPWGRPDMAYFKWTNQLLTGEQVEVRDRGEMYRDMTYIDDVVFAINKLAFEAKWGKFSHEIFNIGNRTPVKIGEVFEYIRSSLGVIDPKIIYPKKGTEEPLRTWADTTRLESVIGFAPDTDYRYGVDRFLEWHKGYYEN